MKASFLLLLCALLSGCGRPSISGLFGFKLGQPVPTDCMVLVSWTNRAGGYVVLDVAPAHADARFTKYCLSVSNGAVCGIAAFCASPEAGFQYLLKELGKASVSGEGFVVWTNDSRVAELATEKGGGRVSCADVRLLTGAPWRLAAEEREWELTEARLKEAEAASRKSLEDLERETRKSIEESKMEEAKAESNAVESRLARVAMEIAGGIEPHTWTFKQGGQFAGYFDSIRGTNIMVKSQAGAGVFALPIGLLCDEDQALIARINR
jgi:hypothetical protein